MNTIKESHLYNSVIEFEINDSYTTIDSACKARLDIFKLPSIQKYTKILYLDTDILIKNDISTIFDICKDDKIYALEEGRIDSDKDFWGKTLFGDEITKYSDKTAFSSGILLFKTSSKLQHLFHTINEDCIHRKHYFHDQPYIIYNSFKLNMYDNKSLKTFAVNNNLDIHSKCILHHFPGGPGKPDKKLDQITNFLMCLKEHTISNIIEKTKQFINKHLLPCIQSCGEKLEGNIFMTHNTSKYTDKYLNKVKNLSSLVLNKNTQTLLEIGFNAGFSALLFLYSNPNIKLLCVDLAEHTYTKLCYDILKKEFGDRISILYGDSTKILPTINTTFDIIHIDGGHSIQVATSDIVQSYRISKHRTILIMDDYDFPKLHPLWDTHVTKYNLRPLNIKLFQSPHHDIRYVIKNS